MGELDHCAKPSPAHPKDSQWGSGLDSVVAIDVWTCCVSLPEPLFHSLSLMNPGIVILEYARAIREEKMFWAHIVAEPRPDQLNQPQITALPPKACKFGTRHDGYITSSTSLLTLMGPSLWNRVNLDSSDHMTFFQSLQLFSRNFWICLCIVCVEMLLLSQLNIAVSSQFYTIWFPQMRFFLN